MISLEGSSEENIVMLFDKISNYIDNLQSTNHCSTKDEQKLTALFDDTSYYVN